MRLVQIAAIVVSLMAPVAAKAQQKAETKTQQGPPASLSSSSIEGTYAPGAGVSSRRVQTRTQSDGSEVITETTEISGPDNTLRMSHETTTETIRTGADSTQTKHEIFTPDAQGRRRLVETTQTDAQTAPDGSSQSVTNTTVTDLNGRLEVSSREIQETKILSPGVKQTDTSIYRPGVNEPLPESERFQQTERKLSNELTQSESTRFLRDANGRWQASETRNQEVRTEGVEGVTEETVQRLSDNGSLALSEKRVTRQSKSNGEDQTVIETYSHRAGGSSLTDPLKLYERVRLTKSTTPDGEEQTIREVERVNPVAPSDPLRVIERTVETLRPIGPDRWEVERQVFGLDGNGRLTPVLKERGEAVGK